jgi:tetratricopeptide (TPR) repeat protein
VDSLRRASAFRRVLHRLTELKDAHSGSAAVLHRLAFVWGDLAKEAEDDALAERRYRKGLRAGTAALRADSTSAWAHLSVAVLQGRLGSFVGTGERIERSRAVRTHANRALQLDSTLAEAYYVRGRWHRQVADLGFFERAAVKLAYGGLPEASLKRAAADFRQALELQRRVHHHLALGKTLLKMGRDAAARDQLKAALDAPSVGPFAAEHKADVRRQLRDL